MAQVSAPEINLNLDSASENLSSNQVDPASAPQPAPSAVANSAPPPEHVPQPGINDATPSNQVSESQKLQLENVKLQEEIKKIQYQNFKLQESILQEQFDIAEVKVVIERWGVDSRKNPIFVEAQTQVDMYLAAEQEEHQSLKRKAPSPPPDEILASGSSHRSVRQPPNVAHEPRIAGTSASASTSSAGPSSVNPSPFQVRDDPSQVLVELPDFVKKRMEEIFGSDSQN
ncbi:hypothetical protein CPB84DRAFT_1776233 [Gymnopilus junonius]|uniref:Uncharacterized protein n=1 Tax=Gymnopilus junonius TaxID=109634 RepID=A0A9P5TP70_GYMJU|nr:hypothetical protein CPB84DRAFT_1776233 [Gymnopilus junonius]